MAPLTINITFDGYWLEDNLNQIPVLSGIYCIYECTYVQKTNSVTLHQLIYIGESENVRNRIASHKKWGEWKYHIKAGNRLCFSHGYANPLIRERAEAAMIFQHKPELNEDFKNWFPFDTTTIELDGKISFLEERFTVYQTE